MLVVMTEARGRMSPQTCRIGRLMVLFEGLTRRNGTQVRPIWQLKHTKWVTSPLMRIEQKITDSPGQKLRKDSPIMC